MPHLPRLPHGLDNLPVPNLPNGKHPPGSVGGLWPDFPHFPPFSSHRLPQSPHPSNRPTLNIPGKSPDGSGLWPFHSLNISHPDESHQPMQPNNLPISDAPNRIHPELGNHPQSPCEPEDCKDIADSDVCEMLAPICVDTKVDFMINMIKCKAQRRDEAIIHYQKVISWLRKSRRVALISSVNELSEWINETSQIRNIFFDDPMMQLEIEQLFRISHSGQDSVCKELFSRSKSFH
ncbi:unnamed protein product [Anisakis simplex]|uniref:LD16921p (inferred by orthology to a D. melanogaster protein) n=1 Tax=Anisakis simplex TaxID=6269 RepID=A0A0M3K0P8_ANISI|nr:unnamed protein product [Anisakis simplex]